MSIEVKLYACLDIYVWNIYIAIGDNEKVRSRFYEKILRIVYNDLLPIYKREREREREGNRKEKGSEKNNKKREREREKIGGENKKIISSGKWKKGEKKTNGSK